MKEAGTSTACKTNMESATSTSMTTELVKAFASQNQRPQPTYLSETDAVSVQDFSRSPYAERYKNPREIHGAPR